MRILKTGKRIGQAVKNVGRLRQILSTFAKHGFADIVERMQLEKFLPSRLAAFASPQVDRSMPERLRMAFEELGPTFVKLGQVLSTRSDLLPEAYIEEFTKLQDGVLPLSGDIVRAQIEKELGIPIEKAFAEFNPSPLAAASIGQVHEATLFTGEKVVIKVQRPDISKQIENDISLLAFLANLLERYVPETQIIGPTIIVDEFFRSISYELDFKVEANNMQKMAENLSTFPEIAIPKVYKELSTNRILTQQKFEGIRVTDTKALEAANIDRKFVVQVGSRAFFKSIMLDGLFHGDLHGGNLFILPGNRLGIIDFGIVGRLSPKSRDQLANMVMALLTEDYENLCFLYAELGAAGASIDFDGFQRELRNTLSPYMGLSLKDLNAGKILIEATKIATKYEIKVPGDWMIVFKAIVTIEGMGRTLDPDFDLMASGKDLIQDIVRSQYSPQKLTKELLWISKDVAALLQVLPRQIRWMFRKFAQDDFAFEIHSDQLGEMNQVLDQNSKRLSLSLLTIGFMLTSAVSLSYSQGWMLGEYPTVSVIFFSLGVYSFLRLTFL